MSIFLCHDSAALRKCFIGTEGDIRVLAMFSEKENSAHNDLHLQIDRVLIRLTYCQCPCDVEIPHDVETSSFLSRKPTGHGTFPSCTKYHINVNATPWQGRKDYNNDMIIIIFLSGTEMYVPLIHKGSYLFLI